MPTILSGALTVSVSFFSFILYTFWILGAALEPHDICENHCSLKKKQGSQCQVSEYIVIGLMSLK